MTSLLVTRKFIHILHVAAIPSIHFC